MIPILVAYNREALQDMMSTLKKFLEGRNDVWREGGGIRKRKEKWKWGSEELEEVQEFKYLGFNLEKEVLNLEKEIIKY